ncbi:enoyl-CoA hydratase/isomerase family protein [Saccharopolyspora rhizosphaerae]|uniref:3-hydroxyisobutyryl-CoA hydrolase n=1 Tax=Saccharopolyspora rhizosphaerae TaxID=2492662 RepID=A0A426K1N6_9PSEU|nr:enoyl-CoA hydratase/isomerase family protein [Saccharopolyspora rhizosphaerae]RRO19308.1 enoyl-CoA hydratase/isomerase family protein [Saccharopolyspora rhizosphaerae]
MTESEILVSENGSLGRITLNRPKALNSLTLGMVREMTEAVEGWRGAEHIRAILIDGAGERGLCAGGDVRALHDAAKAGDETLPSAFWSEEYRLNSALANYPKPVVGIMDGICMGGGVGITAHGSHRVVTERSKVGMPETGIGFIPDVGGTFLMSRAPGELGTHLALTGTAVGGADALYCNLADHHVESAQLPALIDALSSGDVDEVLARFAAPAPEPSLAEHREWIDAAYAGDDLEVILARLRERPERAAKDAATTIETKSPTALKVTLRALRSGCTSLEQALTQEYRLAMACVRIGDFVEGVRATLVDKDRNPQWSPTTLSEVDESRVQKFFEPVAGEPDLFG